MSRPFVAYFAFVLLWLAAARLPSAADMPSAPPTKVGHGMIPFNQPVWDESAEPIRQIQPGTRAYYDLRIAGKAHIEKGRLTPSTVFEGVIGQVVDSRHALVGRRNRVSERTADTHPYHGYALTSWFLLEFESTNTVEVGALKRLQTAKTRHLAACRMNDGTTRRLPLLRVVTSPTWEEYERLWTRFSSPRPNPEVLSFRVEPAHAPNSADRRAEHAPPPPAQPARTHTPGRRPDRDIVRHRSPQSQMYDLTLRHRSLSGRVGKKRQEIARLRTALQGLPDSAAEARTKKRIRQLETEIATLETQIQTMSRASAVLEREQAEQRKKSGE